MYFNYKIQDTFQNSISNTFFQLRLLCGTKYKIHFDKVFEIQILFKIIAVEDRPTYFIALLFPNYAGPTYNFNVWV